MSDPILQKPTPGRFSIRRIPPSHDYIRQHSAGTQTDGRGQAGDGAQTPLYGEIHKFGYTRPPKKHESAEPPAEVEPQSIASPPFVHLHVHSNFSFLDGGSRIEDLVSRAAELGQPALALTDHDGLYGAVRFAKACAKRGVKPIFGAEVRVESLVTQAGRSTDGGGKIDGDPTADPHHLVLLAETREGYANLCRLLSAAHLADPDRERPPLVTLESLRAYAGGLICLTGCRHGEVGYLIDTGRTPEAQTALVRLRDIFGPAHLYVELQYFGYEPHQEAIPGQHGAAVFKKAPAIGNRLRHHCIATSVASPDTPSEPPPPAAPRVTPSAPPRTRTADPRPDLPQGRPQRLNPSDYDVGFHRDERPWRLSCLTYCLQLAALARACELPTVLTTNAHYARGHDRGIHLICRAAGHDKPLSGYPDPAPGSRCLKAKAEIEIFAGILLEMIDPPDASAAHGSRPGACPRPPSSAPGEYAEYRIQHRGPDVASAMHPVRNSISAIIIAESDAPTSAYHRLSPLDATAAIAARCNVDLELGTYHFPQVEVPQGETAYSLLAKRCFRGIARRYKPVPPRAVELLEKELRMIQQMGFAHYFLVVHDIVRWARARGVACSGRGSAGNSIVCHALDITASEPIRHNLLFERFLNPNRREMPDIDVDFCSSRRDEVIEHIYQTFGNQNVAVVANVNTMSPRSAVRIVAEALGYAPTEINALAKHVPHHGDAARIREYLAGAWPELRESPLQDETRYGRLLDLVEHLDSFPMHLGTHLGGFVIADRPITYYAPLQWAAKGVVVVQLNKDDVAALGLVKMDILGLRTHSAVSETVHLIRQRTGRRIRPYDLPPDDPAAYEIISNGGSIGLFQLESAGQRNLASRLQERDFDDIIAAIALYRPGPLEAEMIGPFIDRRWGVEPVSLPHPDMTDAVADTYGVILYQEQVLRIAQSVAGFDLADADSLRRAMTRDRSREEMTKIGETFIGRAVARGVPEAAAREVFRQLEGFAAYGFNKSHSVCFAVISYATAWLKAYYPAEFLCAVLNNYPMGFYTPRTVLNDARRFGLEVRPMDINLSGRGFTVEDAEPPEVWSGGAPIGSESDLLGAAGAGGAAGKAAVNNGVQAPYDPFDQAWTAGHGWGLTETDLAEFRAEQDGDQAYAEALQAALEQELAGAAPPAASLGPRAESPQEGAAQPGGAATPGAFGANPPHPRRPLPPPRPARPRRRGTRGLSRPHHRHRPRRRSGSARRLLLSQADGRAHPRPHRGRTPPRPLHQLRGLLPAHPHRLHRSREPHPGGRLRFSRARPHRTALAPAPSARSPGGPCRVFRTEARPTAGLLQPAQPRRLDALLESRGQGPL
jgi:DNA polymerase III alpha subunit